MSVCAPRGIPLSIFRGRTAAPDEPYWLEDDRLWALAWQFDQDSRLACGCYPDETVGDEHHDRFNVKRVVCERHRSIGEAADVWFENAREDPAMNKHGILWTATHDEEVSNVR